MSIYVKKEGSTKKSNGHWKIKDNCIAEAQKYTTLREWQLKSPGSLTAAYRYKWIFECTAHMRKRANKQSTPVLDVSKFLPKIDKRIESEKRVREFLGL